MNNAKIILVFIIVITSYLLLIHQVINVDAEGVPYRLEKNGYNCSAKDNIVYVVNKTINSTTNSTAKGILIEILELLNKIDCKTLEKLAYYINSNISAYKTKSIEEDNRIHYSTREYYRRTLLKNTVSEGNNNYSYNNIIVGENINKIEKGWDPLLIIINILSLLSLIIGIYVFRIIKKRIDYI